MTIMKNEIVLIINHSIKILIKIILNKYDKYDEKDFAIEIYANIWYNME